jgi:hypothetical protein
VTLSSNCDFSFNLRTSERFNDVNFGFMVSAENLFGKLIDSIFFSKSQTYLFQMIDSWRMRCVQLQ